MLRHRLPLVVTGLYVAIVLLLFVVALLGHDDFGFRFIPVIYATSPLSLLLGQSGLHNLFVEIAAGGVTNSAFLYALLSSVIALRRAE